MSSNLDQLRIAATALYGEKWQRPLSRLLNVSDRTMRRWNSGEKEVPNWAIDKVINILNRIIAF